MKPSEMSVYQKRFDALMNFLHKHPKYFPADFVLSDGKDEKRVSTDEHGDLKNLSDNISWELSQIRNRAISKLMNQHDLSFEQIMALTISDIDLEEKAFSVRRSNGSIAHGLNLSGETAEAITAYLRVRLPTEDNNLFL